MECWPNEFTLTMQTGMRSIVIRFLMCFSWFTWPKFGCKLPKVEVPSGEEMLKVKAHFVYEPVTHPALQVRTETLWFSAFDEVMTCLSVSVQRQRQLKSELCLSSFPFHIAPWNCFDSSSHLLLFIFITAMS